MKKSINDRCPLQVECERKKCDFIRKELECPYYSANAREGYYIEDQEEIRNRQFREHWEHDTVAFLESLKNNGDGKNSCSCQNCKQPDCICAGMQDAKGRADCDGDSRYRDDFATVWDNTIKPVDRLTYGWAANPWVWVISFERIRREALNENRNL